jgi:uncharacterized damage-inducible protein DinB
MTSLDSVLRNHIDFNIWASQRLLAAVDTLTPEQRERDFGTADRNVLGTLLHLYRSERTWLRRLRHDDSQQHQNLPLEESWDAVRTGWPAVHEQWRIWVGGLTESDAEQVLTYKDSKQQSWSDPVWQIALHVVNHSTHHRGQVMGFLRALGTAPPPLDLIFYTRHKAASR